MTFVGAMLGGMFGGAVLGVLTKKPAMGLVGMVVGAIIGWAIAAGY
jgi:hypothetical protein